MPKDLSKRYRFFVLDVDANFTNNAKEAKGAGEVLQVPNCRRLH